MAAQISAGVGHPVTYVDAPPATWRQGLLDAGVPAAQADGLVEMFDTYRRTGGTWVTGGVQQLTGREPRPLSAFLTEELVPALGAQPQPTRS